MKGIVKENKVFHWAINTYGNYIATFVFTDCAEMDKWIKNDFIKLEKEYPGLTYRHYPLDGVMVGDTVMVSGEGSDLFEIECLYQYAPYGYSFGLDSGWTEPVHKCFYPPKEDRDEEFYF